MSSSELYVFLLTRLKTFGIFRISIRISCPLHHLGDSINTEGLCFCFVFALSTMGSWDQLFTSIQVPKQSGTEQDLHKSLQVLNLLRHVYKSHQAPICMFRCLSKSVFLSMTGVHRCYCNTNTKLAEQLRPCYLFLVGATLHLLQHTYKYYLKMINPRITHPQFQRHCLT